MKRSPRPRSGLALASMVLALAWVGAPVAGQDMLARFEDKTTVHVLDNGWTFIIVERPLAPVFSFATMVDVGAAQEVPGITGLAHMFEHMAFKGTPNIGTSDYEAEKKALAEVEKAYQHYERIRRDPARSEGEIEAALTAFEEKQEAATAFVVVNEFGDIIDREGGVGLNAFTNSDHTGYFYSMPANKLELFAYLESERFLHPVFREFYKERDVVQEERRLRTESNPIGRMIEQVISTAYVAHPYKQPVVGYMSDLQSFTATDAEAFFREHYVPANMVTSVVGHVDTAQVIDLAERYFGRIPAGPKPRALRTVEPPQIAEKIVTLVDPSQPIYVEAYHIGDTHHPDRAVYDAIDDILSGGRTSRLYRALVEDRKIAVQTGSFSGLPGEKYPGLWLAFALPAKEITNDVVQAAIRTEIELLKSEDVTDEELARFKTRAKASLLRGLQGNQGLALQAATNHILHGDWRELFRRIDKLDAVSKADIRRVATATFVDTNRTVASIVTETTAEDAPEASGAAGR